jgi:hypothetical protein
MEIQNDRGHLWANRQGMVAMVNRRCVFILISLALTGCGSLNHRELAQGQFNVWGNGVYASSADVEKEASRVCPGGYTKLWENYEPGPAELGHTMFWRIVCNGNSK